MGHQNQGEGPWEAPGNRVLLRPRHADITAGTPRNPGCCRRRLANGSRARPWTGWQPLPRPCAGIESEFYPSGRPPRRGSVGDSSCGASGLLPSAVPQAMLGLQGQHPAKDGDGPRNSAYGGTNLFPYLYYIRAFWSLYTPCRFGPLVLRELLRRNSSARHLVIT